MGEVFVDSLSEARSCIGRLGFVFLLGNPDLRLAQQVFEMNPSSFVAVPESDSWHEVIQRAAGLRTAEQFDRYRVCGENLRMAPEIDLGKDYTIESLAFDELEKLRREVRPDLLGDFWPEWYWREFGLAFAVIDTDGRYVSAASSFAYGCGRLEIEIATHPDFRKRGFAEAVGRKLINHCLEHRIEPCWDAANLGSFRLAQRLGYKLISSYKAFTIGRSG